MGPKESSMPGTPPSHSARADSLSPWLRSRRLLRLSWRGCGRRTPGCCRLLKLTPRQAAPPGPAQAGFFEAPPGPVHDESPQDAKVAFFGALFAARPTSTRSGGRIRGPGSRLAPGGARRVAQGSPHAERNYLPLTPEVLAAHLKGEVHVGLYPLLDGDRCWWLAADFDGPQAMLDALHVRQGRPGAAACRSALEVSRSGSRRARVGLLHRAGPGGDGAPAGHRAAA